MAFKDRIRQQENRILALVIVILLGICAGVFFDYYYDLNDDVLMKDILAGGYTGIPEGHNIQMHWPVSALISLFYRIARGLPWYGLFLCFCHFGCIFLIIQRAVSLCGKRLGKLAVAAVWGCFFGSFFLEHLVYAQYTVTCTLLGATAAFLFYTTEAGQNPIPFIRENIPAILLVWAAYLVRSEMLLLVLPMICVAGVAKWGSEGDACKAESVFSESISVNNRAKKNSRKVLTKENVAKYFGVIGLILLGIVLGQAVHMLAYSSPSWKAFNEFFDNRTELYDFQKPPAYEGNAAFYERIGITESERILFDNYNFGLDDEIDEKMIGEIALYAGQLRNETTPFLENFVQKLKSYGYRLLHGPKAMGSDYPWNYLVILGYLVVLLLAFPKKLWGAVWKLALLFFVRSGLWMYILLGERDPVRITHSLYLMEFCILAAMAFEQWRGIAAGKKKVLGILILAIFGIYVLSALPESARNVVAEQARREEVNAPYQELYAYLSSKEKKENFYFIDVYSSVSYSEKMFEKVDNSLDNYDIMGGWACKSPLWKKKLEAFGIESMEQALKDREDVFFVRKVSEDMDWLEEYYQGHGTPIETSLVKTVAGEFEIYAVHGIGNK